MAKKPLKSENSDTLINPDLTPEENALVSAYFGNGMNQTRAYAEILSIDLTDKKKYDSARVEASKRFAKPNIKAEITRVLRENAMGVEEALSLTADIARGTQYPFIRVAEDGFVYFDFSHPEAKAHLHLIKKIKTKRERRVEGSGPSAEEWEGEWVEVELYDAQAAQRDILKMHGKFNDLASLPKGTTIRVTIGKDD